MIYGEKWHVHCICLNHLLDHLSQGTGGKSYQLPLDQSNLIRLVVSGSRIWQGAREEKKICLPFCLSYLHEQGSTGLPEWLFSPLPSLQGFKKNKISKLKKEKKEKDPCTH